MLGHSRADLFGLFICARRQTPWSNVSTRGYEGSLIHSIRFRLSVCGLGLVGAI